VCGQRVLYNASEMDTKRGQGTAEGGIIVTAEGKYQTHQRQVWARCQPNGSAGSRMLGAPWHTCMDDTWMLHHVRPSCIDCWLTSGRSAHGPCKAGVEALTAAQGVGSLPPNARPAMASWSRLVHTAAACLGVKGSASSASWLHSRFKPQAATQPQPEGRRSWLHQPPSASSPTAFIPHLHGSDKALLHPLHSVEFPTPLTPLLRSIPAAGNIPAAGCTFELETARCNPQLLAASSVYMVCLVAATLHALMWSSQVPQCAASRRALQLRPREGSQASSGHLAPVDHVCALGCWHCLVLGVGAQQLLRRLRCLLGGRPADGVAKATDR
jgi:hypothetical protein